MGNKVVIKSGTSKKLTPQSLFLIDLFIKMIVWYYI